MGRRGGAEAGFFHFHESLFPREDMRACVCVFLSVSLSLSLSLSLSFEDMQVAELLSYDSLNHYI